jgi:hypothetical protein
MSEPMLVDLFHRQIHRDLTQQIDDRMVALARGTAESYDEYRYQVGIITGLTMALERCAEIERERYGGRPSESEETAA